jgi:hypothetical protein
VAGVGVAGVGELGVGELDVGMLGVGVLGVGVAGRDGPVDRDEVVVIACVLRCGAFLRHGFVDGIAVDRRLVDNGFVDGGLIRGTLVKRAVLVQGFRIGPVQRRTVLSG